MNDDPIIIPRALLTSPQYRRLTLGQRAFLIHLYAEHGDCQCFTIDLQEPQRYGLNQPNGISAPVRALLRTGLLKETGKARGVLGKKPRRVFAFADIEGGGA